MTTKAGKILKNSQGMTLLEIMIVLAILGGLITVLVTQVTGRLKKSNVEQTKIQMNQLATALDMFYTDCGFYPESLEGLVSAASGCSNWGPDPYIKEVPKDKWNTPFIYEIDGSNFSLMSLGEDKREGGDGYAKDLVHGER